MRSLQALVAVQDEQSMDQQDEDIAVVELKGLKDIASKYGAASDELKKASEMLSLTAEVRFLLTRRVHIEVLEATPLTLPLLPQIIAIHRAYYHLTPARSFW